MSKFPNFSPNPLDRIERDTYTCLSTHMYTQTQFIINILMLILGKVGGGGGGGVGLPFIKSVFGSSLPVALICTSVCMR